MLKCFIPKLISLHTTSALKLHYVMYSKLLEGGAVKYLGGNIQNYGKLSPQMFSHSFRGVIVGHCCMLCGGRNIKLDEKFDSNNGVFVYFEK